MPTFFGFIPETRDAYLLLHAVLDGKYPMVEDRLSAGKYHMIQSGAVFVFNARLIQRWTDGRRWSPSRELGNFYTYREINVKARQKKTGNCPREAPPPVYRHPQRQESVELNLYGTLDPSYDITEQGLIKRTISIPYQNEIYRLVSYYNVDDVLSNRLLTPMEHLASYHPLAFPDHRPTPIINTLY